MIFRKLNKLRVLCAEPHIQELLKGTVLAFVLKMSGAGLSFGFNIAIARLLGAEGAGIYFLALSVTTIGSVIGRVGLDNALLRFVATKATLGDWSGIKGVYWLGMQMAVVLSSVVTVMVYSVGPWLATDLFNKPELAEPLRWMSLAILPYALLNLHAESLKGLKRIRDAMLIQGIGVPLVGLLLVIPLAGASGIVGASISFLIANFLILTIAVWAWKRALSGQQERRKKIPLTDIWSSCQPLFMVSFLNLAVLPWVPVFLLGIWATSEEVGIFSAALRVAALVGFMLVTINNVIAPRFAELHAKGDTEILSKTAQYSALLTVLLASPLIILLVFGGKWIMGIYGEEFEQGALVLSILAFGQFFNALTGSVGFVLMMGGQESATWKALLISVFVLMTLCLSLTPLLGMLGTAIAVMVSGIVKNVLLVRFCITKMNVMPLPFFRLRRAF